jgi:hypothetical protein
MTPVPSTWLSLNTVLTRMHEVWQPYSYMTVPREQAVEAAVRSGVVPVRGIRNLLHGLERVERLFEGWGAFRDFGLYALGGVIVRQGVPTERLTDVEVDWGALAAYVRANLLPAGTQAGEPVPPPTSSTADLPRPQKERKAATEARDKELQRAADAIWERHPEWRKTQVADEIAAAASPQDRRANEGGSLSRERIEKIIRRPTTGRIADRSFSRQSSS